MVYRPLYHCPHKVDGYEAHVLAVSHFSRWDTKFKRIPYTQVPAGALKRVLPGPFWADEDWEGGPWTQPVNLVTPRAADTTADNMGSAERSPMSPISVGQYMQTPRSGPSELGTRSHFPEPPGEASGP